MKREYRDVVFMVLLLLLSAWALFEARQWDIRARLFPWAVGFPVVALLLIQIATTLRAGIAGSGNSMGESAFDELAHSPEARRRTQLILVWLLVFAVLIYLLGFPYGSTLSTFLYLKISAREGWPISLAITAGTAAFFAALVLLLYVPFPPGVLLALVIPAT